MRRAFQALHRASSILACRSNFGELIMLGALFIALPFAFIIAYAVGNAATYPEKFPEYLFKDKDKEFGKKE